MDRRELFRAALAAVSGWIAARLSLPAPRVVTHLIERSFDGTVLYVSRWDRALTSSEIRTLYERGGQYPFRKG